MGGRLHRSVFHVEKSSQEVLESIQAIRVLQELVSEPITVKLEKAFRECQKYQAVMQFLLKFPKQKK